MQSPYPTTEETQATQPDNEGIQHVFHPKMNAPTVTQDGETFIASASSYYAPNAEAPYKAFSAYETSPVPGTDTNQWTTEVPSYKGGIYSGTYNCCSTTVDGIVVRGEWLQLQCSNSHRVVSFSIMANCWNAIRAPRSFILAASDDGKSWTSLHIEEEIGVWESKEERVFVLPASTCKKDARVFRLIVTSNHGPDEWLTIDKLNLYEDVQPPDGPA